jgi:hypothetical protein
VHHSPIIVYFTHSFGLPHLNRRRGSLRKRVLLFAFISVLSILSIIDSYAPQPYYYSLQPNIIAKLSLYRWRDLETPAVDEVAAMPTPSIPAMRQQSPLRDALFPVRDPTRNAGNVWMDENHRRLRALFTCIELGNCEPNQSKGTSHPVLRGVFACMLLFRTTYTTACPPLHPLTPLCQFLCIFSCHSSLVPLQGWAMGLDWGGGCLVNISRSQADE